MQKGSAWNVIVRPSGREDLEWIRSLLRERWGSVEIVSRGRLHRADELPGFIAVDGERSIGLVTYANENRACEIVTIDSIVPGRGIGSALIAAVAGAVKKIHCRRLWLITTNDNTGAMSFFQKAGFERKATYRNAIVESRRQKPGIPLVGCDGIPIMDEIEFETAL